MSIKNVFHHNTIVIFLKYDREQCNDIVMLQKAHVSFLFQFISNSANVKTVTCIGSLLVTTTVYK